MRENRVQRPGLSFHVSVKLIDYYFDPLVKGDGFKIPVEEGAVVEILLDALREAKEKHPFLMHGLIVMANHYHMVITIPLDAPNDRISQVLKTVNWRLSRNTNRLLGRTGTLINQRTKAVPIEDHHHLARAIFYDLNNPTKTVKRLDLRKYKYSSLEAMLSGGRRGWAKELLDLSPEPLGIARYAKATARWLRSQILLKMRQQVAGIEEDVETWLCSSVAGSKRFRQEVRTWLALPPLKRGPWRLQADPG
jgi:REP element-mobilizing transposase RayT